MPPRPTYPRWASQPSGCSVASKKAQKLLGQHQDAAVARPVLRELAAQAHLDGGNGFTYGLMHDTETARAHRAELDLPAAWKRIRKPKNISWFKP
jgi:hypothetical protein